MSTEDACTQIELFVGTYDNYLFGYRVVKQQDSFAFQRLIAHPTHTASVRSIAANGRHLATGGSDDRIVIVDLRTAQEVQLLTHHTGTVNRVCFTPDGSHLFSASDDGTLAATKTGSWLTDNVWRTPHSGRAIHALAVHPSGKLALTLGRDGTLRTWSLIKGRQCFTTNVRSLCARGDTIESVVWSPQGGRFALIAVDRVLVMSVGSAGVEREFVSAGKQRTTALCWLDENRLLLGQEGGRVRFVEVEEEEQEDDSEDDESDKDEDEEPKVVKSKGVEAIEVQVHENRVKDMAILHGCLVTVSCTSTAGTITLWRLDADSSSLEQLCTTSLGRRPICLALADASVYRVEVPIKAEDSAEKRPEAVVPTPVAARRIVSTGRVTIEKEEDDETADVSTVSVLQTPKAKKAKKRKEQPAVEPEEEDEEEVEEAIVTPAKKPKNKKKVKTPPQPIVETPTVKAKKNKRKSDGGFVESVLTPPKNKKAKKANKSLVEAEDSPPTKENAKNRRKSSKW